MENHNWLIKNIASFMIVVLAGCAGLAGYIAIECSMSQSGHIHNAGEACLPKPRLLIMTTPDCLPPPLM